MQEIRDAGAKLLFIGNGTPEHAQWFVEAVGLGPLPVFTDPRRETYAAAGMKRGVARTALNAKSIGNAVRALRGGHRQTTTKGDPWQLGGVLVLSRKGKVLWSHLQEHAGDLAAPDEALAQLAPGVH